MTKVGIICEYNPFHNGHIHHLEEIKKRFQDSTIILVMSGHFTERGEVSIINKWEKTRIAMKHGVDLVVELPFAFATQSADTFARASIEILTHLQVDVVVFGSESNQVQTLIDLAHIQLENKKYPVLIKEYMQEGLNYPTASSKALFDITGKKIDKPNDILGLSYIREIIAQKSPIEPVTIKRNNDYNSTELNSNMTSATSIRYAISRGEDISSYVPLDTKEALAEQCFLTEQYFPLLKYKLLTEPDLCIFQTVEEGIENRLKKFIISSKSLEEFLLKVKTKRFTYNKLNRMFLHILCNFTKEEAESFDHVPYLRILGFNLKGKEHLNQIKNELTIPLVVRFASIKHPLLDLEFRSTCVYASILEEKKKQELIEAEYKHEPIM